MPTSPFSTSGGTSPRRFLQGHGSLRRRGAECIEAKTVKTAFDGKNFPRTVAQCKRQRRAHGETAPHLEQHLEVVHIESIRQPASESLGFGRIDPGDQIGSRLCWKTNVFVAMAEVHGPIRTTQIGEFFSCTVAAAERQARIQGAATGPVFSESTGLVQIAESPVYGFASPTGWIPFFIDRTTIANFMVHIQQHPIPTFPR